MQNQTSDRLPYEAPVLRKHGSVAELTRGVTEFDPCLVDPTQEYCEDPGQPGLS